MLKKYLYLFKKRLFWKTINIFTLFHIYKLFGQLNQFSYVLIKKSPNFPFLTIGNDFDIFVTDLDKFSEFIIGNYKVNKKFKTTKTELSQNHVQVDLFYKNKFLYKFDLYRHLYESKVYNKSFIQAVLESKKLETFNFFKSFQLFVPSKEMNILIRLFELYLNPHKEHHRKILM